MHQVSLAVSATFLPMKLLGPIFCGCNLLRRGRWQAAISNCARRFINDLKIATDRPQSEGALKYALALLNLLEWNELGLENDEELGRKSRKKEA